MLDPNDPVSARPNDRWAKAEARDEDHVAIIGVSPAMRRLRTAVSKVARFPTAVLITGETGTGKGAVARALHQASPRRSDPFVHVDCAGLVDSLLEAELYGVARGGYTGATRCRAGRFETVAGGTLFLDEVGELSPAGQIKLLRVLEEGTFERIGETRTRRLRARVVTATHVDLEQAVAERCFRADLFYRLRVLGLRVPPLRERREDLMAWIARAAQRAAERLDCPAPRFEAAAVARLHAHPWPGNLRELFHVVEAATILSDSESIEAELLEGLLSGGPRVESRGCAASDERQAARRAAELELERTRGNLSRAARRLGIPRSTLRYRLGLDDAIKRGRRRREGRPRAGE